MKRIKEKADLCFSQNEDFFKFAELLNWLWIGKKNNIYCALNSEWMNSKTTKWEYGLWHLFSFIEKKNNWIIINEFLYINNIIMCHTRNTIMNDIEMSAALSFMWKLHTHRHTEKYSY